MVLDNALKDDALRAFSRAIQSVTGTRNGSDPSADHQGHRALLAVDASHAVIFKVLASGAGGQAFYDALHISKLVSIATTAASAMDAHAIQERIHGSDPVVFVVPPLPTVANLIADVVRPLEDQRKCCVLWLPAATSECTLEMERQGVAGFVTQANLSLGLIPIDNGVAALCHDAVFGELYVKGDHRALTNVVKSILAIEKHMGGVSIGDIVCHGEFAYRVHKMLMLARKVDRTTNRSSMSSSSSNIDKLIVIDRMQDPLSMLLTPMTYEGLLDALLDVNHGVLSYETGAKPSDDATTTTDKTTQTVILNHRDELYSDIRDVNFNILISKMLVEIAQDLVQQARIPGPADSFDSSTSSSSSGNEGSALQQPPSNKSQAAAFAQVQALLKKVPNLVKKKKSLAHHLALVHKIRALSTQFALRGCVETEMAIMSSGNKLMTQDADCFLEEAIVRDPPLDFYDVVKLLCLCSLVRGGLKPDKLLWYRKQLCHTYGYHVLPLLIQLEKLDLLSTHNKFDFPRIKKTLTLMCGALEDEDTLTPRDIHFMFPYTGYAPMSVRLVQDTLGMKYKKGIMQPSSTKAGASSGSISSGDGTTSMTAASSASSFASGDSIQSNQLGGRDPVNVLVYYIGGVTVAELAAYRFLNQHQTQYMFMIAATSVCNGNRILRAI
ncbi:Vacuolar protein sorting-associated protein 33a-like, partial [Globisporangium splendens]